jgi:hypothetical protein
MEATIIIGIALLAFMLWEIKRAIERPEKLKRIEEEAKHRLEMQKQERMTKRSEDWSKRHPNPSLGEIFEGADRHWPTAEEEAREAEKERRRIEEEDRQLSQDPAHQIDMAVIRGATIDEIKALKKKLGWKDTLKFGNGGE